MERQPWELAKREEVEGLAMSSSQEKGENLSGSLKRASDGELKCMVSQGEPLMQEQREIERNAGVNERPSEMEIQQEYRSIIESISLKPETFTHGFSAYQTFARLDNQAVERSLNLIYTKESMLRAKDAIAALPSSAGEDFEYNDSNEELQDSIELSLGGEGEGPSSSTVNLLKLAVHLL